MERLFGNALILKFWIDTKTVNHPKISTVTTPISKLICSILILIYGKHNGYFAAFNADKEISIVDVATVIGFGGIDFVPLVNVVALHHGYGVFDQKADGGEVGGGGFSECKHIVLVFWFWWDKDRDFCAAGNKKKHILQKN